MRMMIMCKGWEGRGEARGAGGEDQGRLSLAKSWPIIRSTSACRRAGRRRPSLLHPVLQLHAALSTSHWTLHTRLEGQNDECQKQQKKTKWLPSNRHKRTGGTAERGQS